MVLPNLTPQLVPSLVVQATLEEPLSLHPGHPSPGEASGAQLADPEVFLPQGDLPNSS